MHRFTDQTWEAAVLGSPRPVAVVFWAEWCVPSRAAVEAVEKLSRERLVSLELGALNVDDNPVTTERYGIQGLPTLLIFQGGQAADRRVGLLSREDLSRWLERHA